MEINEIAEMVALPLKKIVDEQSAMTDEKVIEYLKSKSQEEQKEILKASNIGLASVNTDNPDFANIIDEVDFAMAINTVMQKFSGRTEEVVEYLCNNSQYFNTLVDTREVDASWVNNNLDSDEKYEIAADWMCGADHSTIIEMIKDNA